MLKFFLFSVWVLGVLGDDKKEGLQMLEEEALQQAEICMEKLALDEQSIKTENGELDPCLLACIFKGFDMINSDGMFVFEAVDPKYLVGIEDKETVLKITKECASVNEEKVSDGKEGCERATLLLKCLTKLEPLLAAARKQ
uniref:Odorant-binding protein 17 n=1 Tax=Cnaphalocrocis medinalis TaxID=437488 RepID=A0A0U2RFH5_CNAME|nr:odorant-binding protein 17 [Cnaphalocrocis medinalis]